MGTIGKRFEAIGLENNEENRRRYRELLFTTPGACGAPPVLPPRPRDAGGRVCAARRGADNPAGLNEYISGVICFEETLFHSTSAGVPFTEVLSSQGIIPGIKVDKGVVPIGGTDKETVTQGLDDLAKRCERYYKAGARFAKWRGVLNISSSAPSELGISLNVEALARYASICQVRPPLPPTSLPCVCV